MMQDPDYRTQSLFCKKMHICIFCTRTHTYTPPLFAFNLNIKKEIFSLCCRDHNTSHTSRRHVFTPHYKCVVWTSWLLSDVGWLVISKNIAHFPIFHIKDQRIYLHNILSSSAIALLCVCAAFA